LLLFADNAFIIKFKNIDWCHEKIFFKSEFHILKYCIAGPCDIHLVLNILSASSNSSNNLMVLKINSSKKFFSTAWFLFVEFNPKKMFQWQQNRNKNVMKVMTTFVVKSKIFPFFSLFNLFRSRWVFCVWSSFTEEWLK